jgi:hypothetical protein
MMYKTEISKNRYYGKNDEEQKYFQYQSSIVKIIL